MGTRFMRILNVNLDYDFIILSSPAKATGTANKQLRPLFDFAEEHERALLASIKALAEITDLQDRDRNVRQDKLVELFMSQLDLLREDRKKEVDSFSSHCHPQLTDTDMGQWERLITLAEEDLPGVQKRGFHTLESVLGLMVILLTSKCRRQLVDGKELVLC